MYNITLKTPKHLTYFIYNSAFWFLANWTRHSGIQQTGFQQTGMEISVATDDLLIDETRQGYLVMREDVPSLLLNG